MHLEKWLLSFGLPTSVWKAFGAELIFGCCSVLTPTFVRAMFAQTDPVRKGLGANLRKLSPDRLLRTLFGISVGRIPETRRGR